MRPKPCPIENRGIGRLLAACLTIGAVWFGLLPLVGRTHAVRAHIERNAAAGVDPSAKFYSELPGMPMILERVDSTHRRAGSAFWTLNGNRVESIETP